jgi:hypothetical protein
MKLDKAARRRRSEKKIASLVRKGTPFNISKVSGTTLQIAANVGPSPELRGAAKGELRRRAGKGKGYR